MVSVRAKLFGSPAFFSDSQIVRGLRHKSTALLAYLAVEGRPIGRDTLATLLWPHSGQSRARANLRSCLYQISERFVPVPITCKNDFVQLNTDNCKVDVCEFRALISRFKTETKKPSLTNMLRTAEQLCSGTFLEGFTLPDCPDFDTWEFLNEELFRRQLAEVVRELAEISAGEQNWTEALRLGRRLIELDPLEESSHRLLMQFLAVSGQRSAALRQYEECRHFLETELDDEPERKTEELLQAIKAGTLTSPSFSLAEAPTVSQVVQVPSLSSKFFGREQEIETLKSRLKAGYRVCTIVGTAGAGKTRCAIESTRILHTLFPGGIIFIDLTRIKCSEELPSAIAGAAGLLLTMSSREEVLHSLALRFIGPDTLLVLDNFEHVVDCAEFIEELILSTENLFLMITSRESLRIPSEHVLSIKPFQVSGKEERHAVQLFRDRAAQLFCKEELDKISDDEVSAICRQLDGLPLAIELAVPLLKIFSVEELSHRLAQPLQLLHSAEEKRNGHHSSLQQAIHWSYRLLSSAEAGLFRSLGVFTGGFTLEAARAVIYGTSESGDPSHLLKSLIDKSLVVENGRLRSGEKRFSLLETIRQYAQEKAVQAGTYQRVLERFVSYYSGMIHRNCALFHGPDETAALNALAMEHANIQLTLRTLYEHNRLAEGLDLCTLLNWYWYRYGHFSTGENWLAAFLEASGEYAQSLQARGIVAHAWLLFVSGEWRKAYTLYAESLYMSRQAQDKIAETRSLAGVGVSLRWMGDVEKGNEYTEQAVLVARSTGDKCLLIYALIWAYATTGGEFTGEPPLSALEEAADLARHLGDQWSYAHILNGLGDLFSASGEFQRAQSDYQLSLQMFQELGDRWMIAWCEEGLGLAALRQAQYQTAGTHSAHALSLFHQLGDQMNVAVMLLRVADIHLQLSHTELAAKLAGGVSLIIDSLGTSDEGRSPRIAAARERCRWYESRWRTAWAAGRRAHQHELITMSQASAFTSQKKPKKS